MTSKTLDINPEIVQTDDDGDIRDSLGRFQRGNRAAQNLRDYKKAIAAYLKRGALVSDGRGGRVHIVLDALIQRAAAGDPACIKLWLEYVVGRPSKEHIPASKHVSEWSDAELLEASERARKLLGD